MEEDTKIVAAKTRRAFVKTAAQVAVTAPAVAMLLTASTKSANAQLTGYLKLGDDTVVLTADDGFADDTFVVPGGDDTVTTDGL